MKCVVDASVILAALIPNEMEHENSLQFLKMAEKLSVKLVCPCLMLIEIAAAIARVTQNEAKSQQAILKVKALPHLRSIAISSELAEKAIRVAQSCFLKGADSIYVALAMHESVQLVTLDKEMKQRASSVVTALTPAEWMDQ